MENLLFLGVPINLSTLGYICYLITGCLCTIFIIGTSSNVTLLKIDDRVILMLDTLG